MSNANWSATKNLNVLADGVQIDDGLCESVGQTNAIMHIMASLASGASPEFAALTVTGNFTVDTTTLHVDSANNRVGIGTTSPDQALHVTGVTQLDNHTLIGATSVTTTLAYDHKLIIGGTGPAVVLREDDASQDWTLAALGGHFYIRDDSGTATVPFKIEQNAPTNAFVIAADGDVGIGTASPSSQLEVTAAGACSATVSTTGASGSDARFIIDGFDRTWWLYDDGASGASRFAIRDHTNSTEPFAIARGAGGSSLVIAADGVADFGVGINLAGGTDLKNYVEGTWTPVVADAATGGNTATGTFEARYTRIGNVYIWSMSLNNIDTTGMTGGNDIFIRAFPWTFATANIVWGPPVPTWSQSTSFVSSAPQFVGNPAQTYGRIRPPNSSTYENVSTLTSGSADIEISGVSFVD